MPVSFPEFQLYQLFNARGSGLSIADLTKEIANPVDPPFTKSPAHKFFRSRNFVILLSNVGDAGIYLYNREGELKHKIQGINASTLCINDEENLIAVKVISSIVYLYQIQKDKVDIPLAATTALFPTDLQFTSDSEYLLFISIFFFFLFSFFFYCLKIFIGCRILWSYSGSNFRSDSRRKKRDTSV